MVLNIATYAFVPIEAPEALATRVRIWAESARLVGTVLVAEEGINLFLAGDAAAINLFLTQLREDERFATMPVKMSESEVAPFGRLKVKVKPEIVTFRRTCATPFNGRAPCVSPTQLSNWIARGHDDAGRRLVLLDTRNREEVGYGTFENAVTLPIDNFTELPEAVTTRCGEFADATVVSFCTGGIRCEKAALWMREQGMDNVLQLDGGILGYFEVVGGNGYTGSCFVFDDRVALDPRLRPVSEVSVQGISVSEINLEHA